MASHGTKLTQSRALGFALLLGLVGALACGPRLFDVPEPEVGEPVCMLAVSKGHWEDGSSTLIIDQAKNLHPAGCACLPTRVRSEWTEDDLDMLAELALAECEQLAEARYDFDWTDCQIDYEAKAWYLTTYYVGADGNTEVYMPDDLFCVDPD